MKNYRTRSILLAILSIFMILTLASCGKKAQESSSAEPEKPALLKASLIHEPEFGGIYITSTIEDFNALGFEYGDSVRIEFSNGFVMEDLPYYNGYYTANGEPLLVAYPGYDYIKACINNGNDLWEIAGIDGQPLLGAGTVRSLWSEAEIKEGVTADITLQEKGKYFDIQNARNISYYDDREKYPSDEVFANFRACTGGNLKEGILYRSASPCDNQHNRAPFVNDLIEKAGVSFILDLADTTAKIDGYIAREDFDSPYFLTLYQNGKVEPIGLNMNYSSDDFKIKIANGLKALSQDEGPYLVHCTEGKDRTGFICVLLEALAGADYTQIKDDYMLTYDNYYTINAQSDPDRYEVIVDKVLNPMIQVITGERFEDLTGEEYAESAVKFLSGAGMSDEEIALLVNRLTGK